MTKRDDGYKKEFIEQVIELRKAGRSDTQIREALGISIYKLRKWRIAHPEFKAALKRTPEEKAMVADSENASSRNASKYRKEYAEQARKLCLLSYTNADLADFFGVDVTTINNWMNEIPDFRASVVPAKDLADAEIVEKLAQKALGYSQRVEEVKVINNRPVKIEYTKNYPPDTTAAIFWLKNRQSQRWRDRREIAVENAEELTPWSEVSADVDE